LISQNKIKGDAGKFYNHLQKTVQFLEENVFLDNGNCAFLLTETGQKKESNPGKGYDISIFADCFVAIGLAGYAGLTKDTGRFERALELYHSISERIGTGEFRSEPYPIPAGYRSHAITMIQLNVAQELADTADKVNLPQKIELLKDSVDYMKYIMEEFYHSDHSVVEMLPNDPTENPTLLSRHLNPGHAIESMWLVVQTARKTGQSNYIRKALLAIEKAIDSGWDIDYDGLFRFVDVSGGKPEGVRKGIPYEELITDTWDMKLWWPHSEALYATLLGFDLTGNENMLELHQKIHTYVFDTFPNPDKSNGEWIQVRDRKGQPLDKVAALPVKDPYHILRNILLIIELLAGQIKHKR
jgi:N-acylglucosamine 2-epimerase